MSVCNACGHARLAHRGGVCTLCGSSCRSNYSTALNVASPSAPATVGRHTNQTRRHPLAGTNGPLHVPEAPKPYVPTTSTPTTLTRRRHPAPAIPTRRRPPGAKKQLLDFVEAHLSPLEQSRLLGALERAHDAPTRGTTALRRLEHLVIDFLDAGTARRYYETLGKRLKSGQPLLRD
jgi:hypothetical protein